MFGRPETTTGGKALKFYASVRLDVRRIETLKDGQEAVGNRVRVKVVKNKVAPPFRQAEFDIMFGSGISREGGLIDIGVEQGFVRKAGAWYTYEGDQLGQGKENARAFLRDNPDLADELEKRIKEKLGIGAAGRRARPSRRPSCPPTSEHGRTAPPAPTTVPAGRGRSRPDRPPAARPTPDPEPDPESVARTIVLRQLTGGAAVPGPARGRPGGPRRPGRGRRAGARPVHRGRAGRRRGVRASGSGPGTPPAGWPARALSHELRGKGVDDETVGDGGRGDRRRRRGGRRSRAGRPAAAAAPAAWRARHGSAGWSGCWPARATRVAWRSGWCARRWPSRARHRTGSTSDTGSLTGPLSRP